MVDDSDLGEEGETTEQGVVWPTRIYAAPPTSQAPDTALGSAANKTDTVTVLAELRGSQEDMHLANKYPSLREQAQG